MRIFGILTMTEGHNRIVCVSRFPLTIDNINDALDRYAPYRLPGDIDEAYDFLTNPQRKGEHNLYLGQTESYCGTDEEYFFVREENATCGDLISP